MSTSPASAPASLPLAARHPERCWPEDIRLMAEAALSGMYSTWPRLTGSAAPSRHWPTPASRLWSAHQLRRPSGWYSSIRTRWPWTRAAAVWNMVGSMVTPPSWSIRTVREALASLVDYLYEASQQLLLDRILASAGVQPLKETPAGGEAHKRVNAKGRGTFIAINYEPVEQSIKESILRLKSHSSALAASFSCAIYVATFC